MTQADLQKIEGLFHKARLLEAADRAAFLDQACAADLSLRSEVESLLAHADRGTAEMSLRPRPEAAPTLVERGPLSEGPGTRIGPYKILQQIGEGGFGVVYMAEQDRPVRRTVAIKIIKLGMDTRQVIARFEAERQALAVMEHPGIARVLDGGATETGRPYFVMELVRGIPITEFCDSRNLSARQRLELFMNVCQAVQHAHQKGIIHRDLKPSNVLVTLHDDRPVPKIIDFGIAKATSQRLTERTLFTEFRQFVGTPEYMSPDQADISGLDIDTRTDIYSLGVLLYELLTGTTPLDGHLLRTHGYADIQRIIRDVEPPVPSTRITMLGREPAGEPTTDGRPSLAEVARRRHTEPAALRRLMRGDIDWIVMKAMEKDRTRRYQTAAELVADIRRHLNDEPVQAGPPGVVYRLRKFLRRHRVGTAAAGLVVAAVLVGLSLATIGFVRARRQAEHSQAVSGFLQDLITRLEQDAAGGGARGEEIVARGRALFGEDHALVGTLLTTRAAALRSAGRLDEAIAMQSQAVDLYRTASGADSPAVAAALSALGALLEEQRDFLEAERTYREALDMKSRLYGPASRQTADALEQLNSLLVDCGDPARAGEIFALWPQVVDAYRRALGPSDRATVLQLCQLGTWLHNNNYPGEARPLLEDAVAAVRTVEGIDDLHRFLTINALAQHRILQQRDMAGAIPLVEELMDISRTMWGDSHQVSFQLQLQLIPLHQEVGSPDLAARTLVDYLARRRSSAVVATYILLVLEQQAWAAMKDSAGIEGGALRDFLLLIADDARTVVAPGSEDLVKVLERVSAWLAEHGENAAAEPLLREKLAIHDGRAEADPAARASTLVRLGTVLVGLERAAEAEPLLRECLEIRRETLGDDDWLIASAQSALGDCLSAQGRMDEAEPLLLDGHRGLMSSLLTPPERRREARDRLARLYERWGRPDDARAWRD